MNDAEGVRLGNAVGRVHHVSRRAVGRKSLHLLEERAEIEADEQLHHEKGRAVAEATDVVDAHRVRTAQTRSRARLALESCDGVGIGARRLDQLDGDPTLAHKIVRCPYQAHAAVAEDALETIPPRENVSWAQAPL